jgi:hypothetical protein
LCRIVKLGEPELENQSKSGSDRFIFDPLYQQFISFEFIFSSEKQADYHKRSTIVNRSADIQLESGNTTG